MKKLDGCFLFVLITVFMTACDPVLDSNIPPAKTPELSLTPEPMPAPSALPASAAKRDIEGTARVWMSLNSPGELLDISKWQYVYENVDALQIRIHDLNETDSDDLSDFAALLNSSGIRLTIECDGLDYTICEKFKGKPASVGRISAMKEVAQLERLRKAGYEADYVMFDHPTIKAVFPYENYEQPPQVTYAEAAEALEFCMKYWRESYPDIKFYFCPNFPNNGWKGGLAYWYLHDEFGRGDFYEEFQAVLQATRKGGVEFEGLICDNPYDYITGEIDSNQKNKIKDIDWFERVMDLEREVRSAGLEFALFYNSDQPGMNGPAGLYYRDTLKFINEYAAKGGRTDIAVIESWYPYPAAWVPEDELYTMTNLTRDVIRQLKYGQVADLENIDMSAGAIPAAASAADKWQFDSRVEGWIERNDIAEMRCEEGALYINCTGGDPYIYSAPDLHIPADQYGKLRIRIMYSDSLTGLQVFFVPNGPPDFSPKRCYTVTEFFTAGEYTEVIIDLASHPLWKGDIGRLRIDPASQPCEVWIDSIVLEH
ncbi:MAG: hypothetical protein BWY11_02370 [Firmicutes bacterium ADurb.Bin182]|nr:MAG: hypothetical protein BWY11_02370 [Firmicutes bacterium ADurb.Bin182]